MIPTFEKKTCADFIALFIPCLAKVGFLGSTRSFSSSQKSTISGVYTVIGQKLLCRFVAIAAIVFLLLKHSVVFQHLAPSLSEKQEYASGGKENMSMGIHENSTRLVLLHIYLRYPHVYRSDLVSCYIGYEMRDYRTLQRLFQSVGNYPNSQANS